VKIIVFNGRASCGKTTTLKKLYALLVSDATFTQFYFKKCGNDLSAMFECGNKKLGLTTFGDGQSELEPEFQVFQANNCDVVICASRSRDTKNGAVKFIKTQSNQLIWVRKAHLDFVDTLSLWDNVIDEINSAQAKGLLEEIKQQLK
jgi:hypothetical protein